MSVWVGTMYVGNKHTANVEQLVPLPFHCDECGWEQLAIVVSFGQGQGNSAYFLDEDGAKERAETRAGEAAQKNAEKMLALATCPSCFGQSREAVARHNRNKWLVYLAFVAGCAVFGLILSALIEGAWAIGIAAVSCAAGLWVAGIQNQAIEQGADARVVFPELDAEPDADAEAS